MGSNNIKYLIITSQNCSTADNLVFQLPSDKPLIIESANNSDAFSITSSSVNSLSALGFEDLTGLSKYRINIKNEIKYKILILSNIYW